MAIVDIDSSENPDGKRRPEKVASSDLVEVVNWLKNPKLCKMRKKRNYFGLEEKLPTMQLLTFARSTQIHWLSGRKARILASVQSTNQY